MNTQELVNLAEGLGIDYYNENDEYISLSGINGHTSILFTDVAHERASWQTPATMEDFAKHLKQMGRDSLKMELETLLNITKHA